MGPAGSQEASSGWKSGSPALYARGDTGGKGRDFNPKGAHPRRVGQRFRGVKAFAKSGSSQGGHTYWRSCFFEIGARCPILQQSETDPAQSLRGISRRPSVWRSRGEQRCPALCCRPIATRCENPVRLSFFSIWHGNMNHASAFLAVARHTRARKIIVRPPSLYRSLYRVPVPLATIVFNDTTEHHLIRRGVAHRAAELWRRAMLRSHIRTLKREIDA
jgi:hypothetical protein